MDTSNVIIVSLNKAAYVSHLTHPTRQKWLFVFLLLQHAHKHPLALRSAFLERVRNSYMFLKELFGVLSQGLHHYSLDLFNSVNFLF